MVDIGTIAAVGGLQEDVLEVGRVVDRVGGRDQLHVVAAVVDEDRRRPRRRRASPAAPRPRPVMSMPRSEARSRSIATASCGCVGSMDSRGCWKRGSFSISATILSAASPSVVVVVADDGELQAVAGAADAEAVRLHRRRCGRPAPASAGRLMSAMISCWLRSRSSHGASVSTMKPLLSRRPGRRSRRCSSTSPESRSGWISSSICAHLLRRCSRG